MPTNTIKTAVAAVLALALIGPGATLADDGPNPANLEAAKAAFAKGKAAFGRDDYKGAVASFKESFRLSKNPLLLYNIGYALEAADDKKLALFYYKKFLADTPKDAANRDVAKERAEALTLELAEESGETIESAANDPEKIDSKAGVNHKAEKPGNGEAEPQGFEHAVIVEVPPGKPIDVTAFAPKNIGWKVTLHYRPRGAADFTAVEMQWRYRELVARIPAAAVRGGGLHYYVEARDIGDEMVARSGKKTSPHLVSVEKSAPPRFYPDFDGGRGADGGEALAFDDGTESRDSGPTNTMTYAKWGTTGGAIGLVALSATFFAIAADASSSLEGVAVGSAQQDTCPEGRPCRPYSDSDRALEARGKRFETLGNAFFGVGLAAGVAAGVLWYFDAKSTKSKKKSDPTISATPTIAPDNIGATVSVRF